MTSLVNTTVSDCSKEPSDLFFENYNQLYRLCSQRFEGNPLLADAAMSYLLEALSKDNWKRIRGWEGKGTFTSYLIIIAKRLLIDFYRKKYGRPRRPRWLYEKSEKEGLESPWNDAYDLLVVQKSSSIEALEQLRVKFPARQDLQIILSTIRSKSSFRHSFLEEPLDNYIDLLSSDGKTDIDLQNEEKNNLLLAFTNLLENGNVDDIFTNQSDRDFLKIIIKIKKNISNEDRLMLRLCYINGIKPKEVKKMLSFKGDIYYHLNKIKGKIRHIFEEAGYYIGG